MMIFQIWLEKIVIYSHRKVIENLEFIVIRLRESEKILIAIDYS